MSDEHAPHCSSVYGHPLVRTPNLERLAAGGGVRRGVLQRPDLRPLPGVLHDRPARPPRRRLGQLDALPRGHPHLGPPAAGGGVPGAARRQDALRGAGRPARLRAPADARLHLEIRRLPRAPERISGGADRRRSASARGGRARAFPEPGVRRARDRRRRGLAASGSRSQRALVPGHRHADTPLPAAGPGGVLRAVLPRTGWTSRPSRRPAPGPGGHPAHDRMRALLRARTGSRTSRSCGRARPTSGPDLLHGRPGWGSCSPR